MYVVGYIVGGVIGTMLFAGVVGWLAHRFGRLPIEVADAIGVVVIALLAGLTNTSPFSKTYWGTVVVYLCFGIVSYGLLYLYRGRRTVGR